jgi:hypothetical protein
MSEIPELTLPPSSSGRSGILTGAQRRIEKMSS